MEPLRVLILEDDPSTRALYDAVLRRLVWRCESTAVARLAEAQALVAAANPAFDVAMLDLNVLDSNGAETWQAWRHEVPRLPTIILSGQDAARDGKPVGDDHSTRLDKGDVSVATIERAIGSLLHMPEGA